MRLDETATWAEIHAQPGIWEAWAPELAARAADIGAWIAARAPREIWLCGAGTSAFVGEIAAAGLPDRRLRAVATTDIVACPQDWLPSAGDALVVQFGRSGDSSESVGLLDLLDAHAPRADRLHVTCNPAGALATRASAGAGQLRVLLLPEETHDAGFAMTSSFTTMLLSALACLGGIDPAAALPALAEEARALLPALAARPAPRPGRAIFLGSGALTGAARESALKVLELTAGRTITQWDSPMGFRHGPKSAVDDDTAVFVLLHPGDHTRRFDHDVADEIAAQFPDASVTTIGPGGDISYRGTGTAAADAVLAVLPAQILAARWSADLGLPVDDPFQGRNLSRVVSGVTLHPWAP
ncbi:SIS domain-containing protein [Wenxinia marina]|uniref:Galactosamine 6-phosphate isomerase AgaS n=1 Tax=Wenxinia marina DSM 24838 TaxID=1123501 RepID=A0A0D0QC24_9RHOB|nr:SIS domain-containing protein [Wenxinia marina]KIQ69852.1 galactosamine 6-phosphate isomerase AgaS [Wenxinia marina DSM 24838]GGL61697.1 tagatose-6-phosphate ketose isomerase [Wenxinia marina]